MNAGRFDRLITFQQKTSTRDNVGGDVDTWADFCSMWANYNAIGGNEQTNADRVEAKTDAVFTMRYRSDITNAMRISFDGKYYNIADINEITRRAYMRINATALTT